MRWSTKEKLRALLAKRGMILLNYSEGVRGERLALVRSIKSETHMGIEEADKRARRKELTGLARPQYGVDVMLDEFTGTRPIEGVSDAGG